MERLIADLSAKESKLDVLVNNAGAAWGDTIDDFPVRLYFMICYLSLYANILLGRGME